MRTLHRSVCLFALLALGGTNLHGQVTGRVVDPRNLQPLASVQIHIVGLELGTLTSANGRFVIPNVPPGAYQIRAERIGYQTGTEDIVVREGVLTEVNFSLREQAVDLEGIVVTGLAAAARRREVGTAMTSINLDQTRERALPNLEVALQAAGPGIMSMVNQGQVGASGALALRGPTSVSSGRNVPIIYVDGVRMSTRRIPTGAASDGRNTRVSGFSWNDINMDDVERIEVIKGAAATALYGTEASAGVIQIFTKKGVAGTPQWSFSTAQGANFWSDVSDVIKQHPTRLDIDVAARTGWIQRYSGSVRGGREGVTYNLSASGSDEQGIVRTQWSKHWTTTANLAVELFRGAVLELTNTYTWRNSRQVADGNNRYGYMINVLRAGTGYLPGDRDHSWVLEQKYFNTTSSYVGGAGLNYVHGSFQHKLRLGLHQVNVENTGLQPWGWFLTPDGTIRNDQVGDRSVTGEYVGTVESGVFGIGGLRSRFSWGGQLYDEERVSTSAIGEIFPGPGDHTVSSAAVRNATESRIRQVNAGFFFQETLAYDDLVFVTGAYRLDGSSTFGDDYGFQGYPKLSVSWVVSDHVAWPLADLVPSFRVRAAVGTAGRAPPAFAAERTWNAISARGGSAAAVTPGNLGNPDLGPERTRELEAGFDADVLGGRVGLELTYYDARTDRAIVGVQTIPSLGFLSSQSQNVGVIESSGIELSAKVNIVEHEGLFWGAGVDLTTINSNVVDLGPSTGLSAGRLQRIEVGHPLPSFFARRVTNPDEYANPVFSAPEFVGRTFPDKLINLHTDVSFGGLSFSGTGELNLGGHLVNATGWLNSQRNVWPACWEVQELWTTNRRDEVKAADRAKCISQFSSDAEWIENGSFFKLRNVTLSYRVPERFVPRSAGATFSVSGQNLWKRTDYTGTDPEVHQGGGDAGFREDYYSIPPRRAILTRLNVTF